MGKIRLARVSIAELKRRIEIAEHRKKCLEEYLHNLWNSYQKNLITRDFYVETAHKHFDGKTLKQWVDYYEHYIKECEKHLKKHRKNLVGGHLSVFFFAILIIFVVFIFYSSFGFKLTGFAIIEEVDFENWESYADSDATIAGSAWTNVAGDDCDWMVDSAGTPSTGTGPNIDHTLGTTSGKYFYMETSSGYCQTPSPGSTSIFNSTESYDADTYSYNVSFWYHMFGSTIGTLYFEVYNGSWNTEWSIAGQQHTSETDPYTQVMADLSAYSGTIQFRFRGVQAGQYYSDFALDDINISRTASNSAPTTPTNISCNGGECNISVDTTVNINASGSTDPDSDAITYFVEASLQDITEVQNTTDESKAGNTSIGSGSPVTGQWRDTAGTFDCSPTVNTWTGFPFNTEDSADGIYTQNANDIDVDIGETGHYLILYSLHFTTDYAGRIGHESRLTLDGTTVYGSHSSGYSRDANNDDEFLSGGAIISATAGQDLRVEIVYRTDAGDQIVTPVASDSYLQIIQLDDTWDYFRAHESTGTSMTEASWNQITWEVEDEKDTGSFTHAANSDAIELETTGHYLVVAGYGITETTSRGSFLIRATLNSAPIETSYGYEYIRFSNSHDEGNPMSFTLIEATANDLLRIEARHDFETATTAMTTLTSHTGVMVVALPDGDYYRGHGDDVIDPAAGTSYALLDMVDTEDEEDSGSFNGDALGTVNIDDTSDYLIFFSGEGIRATTTNTARDTTQVKLFVTGAESTFGGGWYDRGDQSTTGTFEGGTSFGAYYSLADTDYIDFRGRQTGDAGDGRFNANQYGITIVNFAGLLSGEGGASNETNTTTTDYTDVDSDFKSVTNITAKVEVDSYDPRASVDQSTNDPDLWLEIYNGTGWVDIGNFDLPSTYTGTGLDTTNYNFSLTTTNPGILSGWQTSTNQDLRIKGVYMDHNSTIPDEINYTNVWITINGKNWAEIGNHTESTNLTWNTTALDEQTGIDLRARARDISGSNTSTAYFTKNSYLNISHGAPSNQAPTIPFVQAISTQNPTEDDTKSITFNFTAEDSNGVSDLNDSTAAAYFQRAGETTRSNTSCVAGATSGNQKNYTCTIDMWYFDQNGAWTINATIKDNSEEYAENSSTTFTYNLLTAMVMSPTALNWPTINLPDTDIGATNDPITLNNTGNDEPMNINITAYNLQGETTTTQYIFANNFTVEDTSQGCSGTAMANATLTNVTSTILYRGNNSLNYNNATSGQEQLFFCLKGVPQDISAQSYSSSAYGAWEIKILLVAIIPAGRRRKKKLKKSNKILKLLIKLTEELREDYSKEKEILINQLIKAVKEEYGAKRKDVLDLIREKEIEIPVNILSKELGALESLVKYMKENLNMKYNEIAKELRRDERTIWTSYKKASAKQPKPMKTKKTKEIIPLSIFKNQKLTILESIISYLKFKGFKFSEIAKLLDRDQRNIWTIYSRVNKKLNKTNERE